MFTSEELALIDNATWYGGAITLNKATLQKLSEDISYERNKETIYTNKLGLINTSDFIKASVNEGCDSLKSSNENNAPCNGENYLLKKYEYWTLNPVDGRDKYVWSIGKNGTVVSKKASIENVYLRPTLYLNNSVKLIGTGDAKNPFSIQKDEPETEIEITEENKIDE